MHVDVRKADGGVIIVDLQGRLVTGTGDEVLRAVMNELVAEGWKRIVLNLSEVTKIDSSGIGELVSSFKLARSFQSSVKLVRLNRTVYDILKLSSLLPVLDIHPDEEQAIASFGETAPG